MTDGTRVVIVGGSIGGVSTAAALRTGGFDGELVLVDGADFPIDRPPLSKEYLAGTRALHEIALEQPEWYDDHQVRLLSRTRATALRPSDAAVELDDGTMLTADRVVLATGGLPARPSFPGADSDRMHVLRSVDDADRLRAAVTEGTRLLIIGSGLIGAEAASTLSHLGAAVTMVDPVSPPLTDVVGPDIAHWLHEQHASHGIEVVQGAIEHLDVSAAGIRADVAVGPPREFDVALLAVGMVPEASLAEGAGLAVGRGVIVDGGQVTSNPAVLAIGDATEVHRDGRRVPRGEHWESARFDGERAAATILGITPAPPTAPWFWTDRHGLHVEVVGSMAGGERVVVRGEVGSVPFAAFAVRDGRVVGAVAVDEPKAVRAARRMIDRGTAVDPDALADPTTDLRRLLRG